MGGLYVLVFKITALKLSEINNSLYFYTSITTFSGDTYRENTCSLKTLNSLEKKLAF